MSSDKSYLHMSTDGLHMSSNVWLLMCRSFFLDVMELFCVLAAGIDQYYYLWKKWSWMINNRNLILQCIQYYVLHSFIHSTLSLLTNTWLIQYICVLLLLWTGYGLKVFSGGFFFCNIFHNKIYIKRTPVINYVDWQRLNSIIMYTVNWYLSVNSFNDFTTKKD